MTVPLLEACNLRVDIAGCCVVDGLDLALQAGERLAILGRNGAGKSTLLLTLSGLRPPAAGEVRLGGDACTSLSPRQVALRRAWLGQVLADPFSSGVLETVLAGRHPHLGRWQWEGEADVQIARSALAAVGLAGMEKREVQTLSSGERQRLAIATLLAQSAPLYLLDEPLSHLDLNHQMAVLELFGAAAKDSGAGVVMVMHEPGLAARYCNRILLVYGDGRVEQGDAATVLTADRLSELYGYPLRELSDGSHRWFVPEQMHENS